LDIVILPKIFNRNHRGIKDNHQQTNSKNVIKFIRVDKNGLRQSNIFALMAHLFHLSLSFDSKMYHPPGFLRIFLMIDDLVVILKIGQAINIELNDCVNVSILQLGKESMINIVFLLMMDMTVIH